MDFYENEENNLIRRTVGWVVDIAVALSFAWFFLTFFGTQVVVNGQSMQPLLNSGEIVLMNRFVYDFGSPDRLDVVVFLREDGRTNIKRVIGIPGDVVQIVDGTVYVNGEPMEEAGTVSLAGLADRPVELGKGEYFLLGDNRESSEDSRFANVGNVMENQIIGKVWLRISPLIDFGLIQSSGGV
ncbi:MAG: signal peptidase I [Clostridiales bacterium]|nr:signal peptidase I [Clostridiales bacterium]